MNKLFDLRFVIGTFFLLIGLLLIIYHFMSAADNNINLWSGAAFSTFGLLMVILSFRKDADDELLERRPSPTLPEGREKD